MTETYTAKETAEILGVSVSTIYREERAIMAKLRELLADLDPRERDSDE